MRWTARIIGALALVALGAWLQDLRAQRAGTIDGYFRHIGFVVKDVDTSAKEFARVLGAEYNPIHGTDPGVIVWPKDSSSDRKSGVRTTELKSNGLEIHLLEPTGGASPWRKTLEARGDGALQHISFGVKNLAGTVAALQKLGGRVVVGAGDSFFAYVEFPNLPFIVELEKVQ